MNIKCKFQLEKVASKDSSRDVINHVYLGKRDGKSVAVSTNGMAMAIVPVSTSDHDVEGMFPAQALVDGRKIAVGQETSLDLNGSCKLLNGATSARPDGNYPQFQQVIPTNEAKFSVAFDAELLYRLALALGADAGGCTGNKKGMAVTLHFTDELSAIRVIPQNCQEALGVIMPMRMK